MRILVAKLQKKILNQVKMGEGVHEKKIGFYYYCMYFTVHNHIGKMKLLFIFR